MRPFLLAFCVFALSASTLLGANEEFSVDFHNDYMYSEAGEPIRVWLDINPLFYGLPIDVDYSYVFPTQNPTPTTGRTTIAFNGNHIFVISVPRPAFYSGTFQGTVTISYKNASGNIVTKSKPIYAFDQPLALIEPQAFIETAGEVRIRTRFDRKSTIPLCVELWTYDDTATKDADYAVVGQETLPPGSLEVNTRVAILSDSRSEGAEAFMAYASACIGSSSFQFVPAERITIYDPGVRATFTPHVVTAFVGDPLHLELSVDPHVNETAWFVLSSSNRNVVAPFSRDEDVTGSEMIPILAASPGEATFNATFADWTELPAAEATIRLFYGDVLFGEHNQVTVIRGETVQVPVQMTPPPPIPFALAIASKDAGVAKSDGGLEIPTTGASAINVTGMGAGKTRFHVTSPGGQLLTEVQVEVLEPLNLSGLLPKSGSASGGTAVVIVGAGFRAPCSAKFGNAEATNVTVVDDKTLRTTTPAHPAGLVDVSVTCGDALGRLVGGFTFNPTRKRSVRH